jgi:hypothetical protein
VSLPAGQRILGSRIRNLSVVIRPQNQAFVPMLRASA